MDLSELIKSYTPLQKNAFTAFCVNWPLLFTSIFVHEPSFRNFDFHLQLIFSASASIFLVAVSYVLTAVLYAITEKTHRAFEVGSLSMLGIMSSCILLINPTLYGGGYVHVIHVIKLFILMLVILFVPLAGIKEYNKRKNKKNKNSLDK